MVKIFLIALFNIIILPEILSSDFHRYGSNDSIQPIEHNPQISRITLTTPDPSFVGCVLNVGGVMLKFKPTKNTDCTLQPGITNDTQLQTNPPIPCGLHRNVTGCSDPWTEQIFRSIGAELMDCPTPETPILQTASNGIVIQAVVFQRTIQLPNFSQLQQAKPSAESKECLVYKWSQIRHLVAPYSSLERATIPLKVEGSALEHAFKTEILNLEFTPNYPTNTGFTVPVYWYQIFEAPFDLCGNPNPIYKIYVDESDFHALKVDKSAVYSEPESHKIYPWKVQVTQE